MIITADQLKKGQKGIIQNFESNNLPTKLLEMGCLPGNTIQLIQAAPLSDPIHYLIEESSIAIRKETAKLIAVAIQSL